MRKLSAIGVAMALAGGLVLTGVPAPPASALSPGVKFSADDLPTWQADGIVWAIAQTQGRVVAGGTFTQLRPPSGNTSAAVSRSALAVLNAETGNPESCALNVGLAGGTPTVRALTTAADGTVYVGGNFSNINGVSVSRLAAVDVVTCTVKSFRAPSISATVRALAVSGDTLYLGGDFQTVGGQPRLRFAALNASSGALQPWVANVDAPGRALAVSADGSEVALGGNFFTVNGEDSHSIGIVRAGTGANVANYPRGFIPDTSVTKALVTDGTSLYVGNEGTGGGVFDGSLKIDWTTHAQVWRNTCLGATQAILPYQGVLYEASHRHDCRGVNAFQDGKRNYFTAARTEDSKLLQWFPTANDGIGEGIGPRALTISAGRTTGKQYLWSGGEFTRINGAAQQSLTRFGVDDRNAPPTPSVVAQGTSDGAIQVRLRSVVDPDDSELTYSIYRNGSSTPIWSGVASSLWWSRPQVTFVDTTVAAGTSYSYRVTASDGTNTSALSAATSARAAAKTADYPARVRADGAELYWRYDETSGVWAQDSSGATVSGLNGLYDQGATRGGAGALPGDPSTSAQFDGLDDQVWSDQLKPGPSTYTIETWFKTTSTSGGKLVGYGDGRPRTDNGDRVGSGNYDRHIYMDDQGQLNFGVFTGGTNTLRSAKAYNDGAWHHVVAAQGSGGMVLYVDGVRVGRNGVSGAQDYYGTWRVGGDSLGGWPNGPASQFFQGSIDETAIYDSVLSAAQVSDHYQLGGGVPDLNPKPADAYGAAVFEARPELFWRFNESTGSTAKDSSLAGQQPGVYGPSAQLGQPGLVVPGTSAGFSGEPESLVSTTAAAPSPTSFTVEAWMKSDTSSGGKIIGFENTGSGNGSSYDKQIYMTNSGTLIFGVYSGGFHYVETNERYNDNVRHHLVGTQGQEGLRLYVDGQLVGADTETGNEGFTGFWRVGGGNLGSWPASPANFNFTGTIDDVAVYDRALTAAEVADHSAIQHLDSQAPSVPADVTAAFEGGSAVVRWAPSTDDRKVAGYRVYRGASASMEADESTKVADVAAATFTDTSVGAGTYFYKVVALDASGNLSAPSSAAGVTVSDTAAPSTPAGVSATVSGATVMLSWAASTDNVGVRGYALYRGATADFSVDDTLKLAEIASTSYTDESLAAGTYYYKVVALDTADNRSAVSAAAAATVKPAAPVEPVVQTVTVSEDAMVAAAAPTTNYGTNNQLSARGAASNSAISSYLKLDLPAAPAGTALTGASLRVRTSNDPTAASIDAHDVQLLTSGSWSEAGIAWNTRPTALGGRIGALAEFPSLNTAYTIDLDPVALRARLGETTSLVLTSEGVDNLRISSKDSTNAAARPTLVLTFTKI